MIEEGSAPLSTLPSTIANPRVYRPYFVIDPIAKNSSRLGDAMDLVQSRCLNEEGSKIPCIQKYIDVMINYGPTYVGKRTSRECFLYQPPLKRFAGARTTSL